jgi:2-keto-4-pentenoate hydratase
MAGVQERAPERAHERLLTELAEQLREAERTRRPMPALTATHPALSVQDAYRIQQLGVAARTDAGGLVRGRKVGLTSLAMQRQLGVDEPDFGALLGDMLVEEGDPISAGELIQPRIEAEIAFVMEHELRGPGVTSTDALRAVAGALPALEIIDSRIADWDIKLVDTVADNASSARVVCAGRLTPLRELDLRLIGVALSLNGAVAATGAGAAVLGNPIRCVAWLANKLGEFGVALREGDVVLAGALHASLPVTAGDSVQAQFAQLGDVAARFVE